MNRTIVAGYTGSAVNISAGQSARIIDLEGSQIGDLFAISLNDHNEVFSPSITRNANFRLYPSQGDCLYSNQHNPMLHFVEDKSPGYHDMLFAPCDQEMYRELGCEEPHPNCRDNFLQALAGLGVRTDIVPDPLNLFQFSRPNSDGSFTIQRTSTQAGDYVAFKALMDLILVVTACSMDVKLDGVDVIDGRSTPLAIEVDE